MSICSRPRGRFIQRQPGSSTAPTLSDSRMTMLRLHLFYSSSILAPTVDTSQIYRLIYPFMTNTSMMYRVGKVHHAILISPHWMNWQCSAGDSDDSNTTL